MILALFFSTLLFATGCSLYPSAPDGSSESRVDRNEIRQVFVARQRDISACYEKNLLTEKDLTGKFVLDFDIDVDGSVSRAAKYTKTTHWEKGSGAVFETCLLAQVKTWKFPPPKTSAVVQVLYPFALSK